MRKTGHLSWYLSLCWWYCTACSEQKLFEICENCAFNANWSLVQMWAVTSSTQNGRYLTNITSMSIMSIILKGVPLSYAEEFKHLGHIFQSDNSMHRQFCKTGKF